MLFVSCVGIGCFAWRWSTGKEVNLINILLWMFAGEVIYSNLWVVISLFLSSPLNIYILLIVLIPFAIFGLSKILKNNFKLSMRIGYLNFILFSILLSIISIYTVLAFKIPFEWDEIAYHFPAMQEISKGKIAFPLLQNSPYVYFYSPFSKFYGSLPFASESFASILYSMSNGNPASAHILYFVNFILFLLLINKFLINRFKINLRTTIIVDILILLNHGISVLVSSGLIDLNLAIYQFLSILVLIKSKPRTDLLYLSIFFIAYAVGQKYTALYLVPVGLIYLCKSYLNLNNFKKVIMYSLPIFIIGGGFWYLKNFYLYKNPIYPLYMGHVGMSDLEYQKLMSSLIFDLKGKIDFFSLLNTIKVNYSMDIGLILSSCLFIFTLFFKKIKISSDLILLLASSVFVYLINFYFGSQLSRYVLITPIIIYVVASVSFNKFKFVSIIILIISLQSIYTNPLQWSVWKPKYDQAVYIINNKSVNIEKYNLGCAFNIKQILLNSNSKAINMWDPYAAIFYDSYHIYDYPENINQLGYLDANTRFVYINNQYRTEFIKNSAFHSDIDIDGRVKIENELISQRKPDFVYGNCLLYNIK